MPFAFGRICALLALTLAAASPLQGAPVHGMAMYGEPALPPDFASLPYVNPEAPQGGRIVLGEQGSFDSLNPHILKGRAPYGIGAYVFETLMGRSWDEPFSLYCLLCESVETPPDRSWVEFTLRAQAHFSDGSPVTVEDVLWSFQTLGTQGHPRYQTAWTKVAAAEITGPRSIRFTFDAPDRELPLILALRPVLSKAAWQGKDFTESGFANPPLGSGPYKLGAYEPGRFVRLVKDPDWWGRDLPFNRGLYNLDEIRYDYFGDGDVIFEAFKAGEVDSWREGNAARWDSAYDFARLASGAVLRAEIPHHRPSGFTGYWFNTRNPLFADWRVREALITAFNYEFISDTLNAGRDPRISSYFGNSPLAMTPGPAEGRVAELLAPFADQLPPGALEGYRFPEGDGTERNRRALARATELLAEAGWSIQDGELRNAAGAPFSFEILLASGATETIQTMSIYVETLKRLGIAPTVTIADSAQYRARVDAYQFDMVYAVRPASLSPGNEQLLYWGRQGVSEPGSRNLAGVDSPAAEAMIAALLASESQEEAQAAAQALDRILTAGRYVIPVWFSAVSRLAYDRALHYPQPVALYGDWIGFQPDVWWREE